MNDIILFGGTTEGRLIAEALNNTAVTLHVSVATEYGETLIDVAENINILQGRKNADEIAELINAKGAELVIDATHPYATEVTKEVEKAAAKTGARLIRVIRKEENCCAENCIFVNNTDEAVLFLNGTCGNILLTVGSKELSRYTKVNDYKNRVYARILPLADALENADKLGFTGSHIICMQGPFTEEFNTALLNQIKAKYMVTKDTGEQGGFAEKIRAANACGAIPVVIRRPSEEKGISTNECIRLICEKYHICTKAKKEVTIIGIGTGSRAHFTQAAKDACAKADVVIGARRVTDALSVFGKPTENAVSSDEIEGIIRKSDYKRIVVAMSGDTGFFSGAKLFSEKIADMNPTVLPGISSVSYLSSKIGVSWDDACIISLHGRKNNAAVKIRNNVKTFILVGGENGAGNLLKRLYACGLGDVKASVGENLSYNNEKITSGTVGELKDSIFSPLSLVYAENKDAKKCAVSCGIPDDCFIRTDVPMTKQEVRAVTISKLRLTKDAVCWDVGAGTGSVSVEMAHAAEDGFVYAIEKNHDACGLIAQNANRFSCDNIGVVEGTAPEVLKILPAPTHVFIGGSGGSIKAVAELALSVNPTVRIVINTVTAESFCDALSAIKQLPVTDAEITEINVSRSRKLGKYNLMTAQNPVYIISCEGKGNE